MTTMSPARYRVVGRRLETDDTATLTLEPVDEPLPVFRPGQFAMLYVFGIGEVPISVAGHSGVGGLVHTIRAVGATSMALFRRPPRSGRRRHGDRCRTEHLRAAPLLRGAAA